MPSLKFCHPSWSLSLSWAMLQLFLMPLTRFTGGLRTIKDKWGDRVMSKLQQLNGTWNLHSHKAKFFQFLCLENQATKLILVYILQLTYPFDPLVTSHLIWSDWMFSLANVYKGKIFAPGAPLWPSGLRYQPWTTMSLAWFQLKTYVACHFPSLSHFLSFIYC